MTTAEARRKIFSRAHAATRAQVLPYGPSYAKLFARNLRDQWRLHRLYADAPAVALIPSRQIPAAVSREILLIETQERLSHADHRRLAELRAA